MRDDDDDDDEAAPVERYGAGDVYKELMSVLVPSCIPKTQGAAWKAKLVTRSYAFDDPSVPREPTRYLKVVYDARYPVPDRRVCADGGTTFEKILGSGAPVMENFLLKRGIMGPSWIRLYGVKPVGGGNMSWCKWECCVDGPK